MTLTRRSGVKYRSRWALQLFTMARNIDPMIQFSGIVLPRTMQAHSVSSVVFFKWDGSELPDSEKR